MTSCQAFSSLTISSHSHLLSRGWLSPTTPTNCPQVKYASSYGPNQVRRKTRGTFFYPGYDPEPPPSNRWFVSSELASGRQPFSRNGQRSHSPSDPGALLRHLCYTSSLTLFWPPLLYSGTPPQSGASFPRTLLDSARDAHR